MESQTYTNIEHIIASKGSTDNTLDFTKKYDGMNNVQYISDPDKEQSDVINIG